MYVLSSREKFIIKKGMSYAYTIMNLTTSGRGEEGPHKAIPTFGLWQQWNDYANVGINSQKILV